VLLGRRLGHVLGADRATRATLTALLIEHRLDLVLDGRQVGRGAAAVVEAHLLGRSNGLADGQRAAAAATTFLATVLTLCNHEIWHQ